MMSTNRLVETNGGKLEACQIMLDGMIGTIYTSFVVSDSGFMLGIATVGYPEDKDVRVFFDVDKIRFIRDALTRMIDEQAAGDE